ncbi:FAD-binding monooxygenase [Streptomyces tremellae]|uniref:FAD-binding monooxygenase n=1 Tax=Streptomyces tremellae TaxID=1124239 RepID=A0ABP7FLI7_9ACTN
MAQRHAVVIGASVGGLLAARALSDHYERVTVLDRDRLPGRAAPRRGVPQGRHVHALLSSGGTALDALFPGFLDELAARGVPSGDSQGDHHMYLDGRLMAPADSGLVLHGVTRPLLELLVRARVSVLPGVTITDGCEATGLAGTGPAARSPARVTGVRVRERAGRARESVLGADLVVDAAGRGSRAPQWLDALGCPRPAESAVDAHVVYATRHYRYEPGLLGGRLGTTIVPYPGCPRGGVAVRQEDGLFAVVLVGVFGEEPPADGAGYAAYARSLAAPDVAEAVESAEPLGEPARTRYPRGVRRHYERLPAHPAGFLALGDALCGFNPVYGQGMTVAALEADLLGRLLRRAPGPDPDTPELPRRFFAEAAALVDRPWSLAAGSDLAFRSASSRPALLDRYLARLRAVCAADPAVATRFLRVAHLLDPPSALLAPAVVLRVARARRPGG